MNSPTQPQCDIAIVGLAGRFPGAPNTAKFWENLCAGVESISHFDDDELEGAFSKETQARKSFVASRAVLEDVDLFDASFFSIQAREAEFIDPQHRVFLECCWEALEDAGYDPKTYSGSIGVIAGCSINSYFLRNVLRDRASIDRFTSDYQVESYSELLGAGHDFLATRVAYKLDLRGPAMTLQSACSTSLNAIAHACQNLMLGQADTMLAGAVSITFPQKRGYVYQAGGMVSADGHCRTFDVNADGTVFGSGAGVIVLKRFADALEAGDTVYARIRGFGITNDGSGKVGFTAPGVDGQAKAIAAAQAMAGVAPAQIGFVECHGTATPLGDPIEFAALAKVFGSGGGAKTCALGSVKSNVGHLDVAAGMTSIIKAALAIHFGKIPPTLHFTAPNPQIDLDSTPFSINSTLVDWPDAAEQRFAGVSAFGLGGTNVHLVLEGASRSTASATANSPQLVIVSARTPSALSASRERLSHYFTQTGDEDFAAAAFTLQTGRRAFSKRYACVAATPADAARKLAVNGAATAINNDSGDGSVAFLFPGQGAQYAGMGRDLYERLPVYRDAIDRCADILLPLIGRDLREVLYDSADVGALTSTDLAQPAIFAVEYALALVWIDWGITPSAMIGHSVGEFVAACLSGVMSIEDALFFVAERGKLMRTLPSGAMLAVRLPAVALEPLLDGDLEIAALNAPSLCVAAGPFGAVEALERRLAARDVPYRRLDTSHAFHSAMVEPVVSPLASRLERVALATPRIPYVSTVTGDWIAAAEATSPAYWAQHCRKPVLFAAGLSTLIGGGITALLEVGPGRALGTFARQGAAKDDCTIAGSLPTQDRERGDLEMMLESLGQLWVAGATPNWPAIHSAQTRRRVPLPTYPFDRKRYWLEAPAPTRAVADPSDGLPAAPETIRPQTEHLRAPSETIIMGSTAVRQTAADASHEQRRTLEHAIALLLEELSGEDVITADPAATFLALGFDSLSLGRFATLVQARFGVNVTFRQLLGDLPSIAALAQHILAVRPPEMPAELTQAVAAPATVVAPVAPRAAASAVESLMRDQLAAMQQLMRDQLAAITGAGGAVETSLQPSALPAAPSTPPVAETPSRFEVFRPGAGGVASTEVTPAQQAHIDELIARTTARTRRSKEQTQASRAVLADPRVAAGFRSEWKEMVYPITCVRAKGSRLWDIDGNEYIDLLNGFGQTAFGHAPDFVVAAVAAQLERGFAIGPQTDLAGEVADLFCELTGNERVTFCNTGSEAVMAALRLARTVTGRDRVVVFNGAYHGQFDEVLVKGARSSHRALPVAPGIPLQSVANMTVLPYGTPESLEWIRDHAAELAAVVAEPVQSRHPALVPQGFLTELRAITQASGTALVFDEVVTGFRVHPGGMQAVFGIRADLATYGKVVGGGMPIGILAGNARFMDALDGGMWQYGDDSIPEVAPTFFAGTFVRHPLTMAAVLAVLRHLKASGPALQAAISDRTASLVERLNADIEQRGLTSRIETYGSLFYFSFQAEERLAGLLYYHLRNRGVYIQEGFPCFLTSAHTDADVDRIVDAFRASFDALSTVGIFKAAALASSADAVPLTEEQHEIWLAAQFGDEASCAFNESITMQFTGELHQTPFAAAWDAVLARHDALRMTLSPTGETFTVVPRLTLDYRVTDVSSLSEADAQSAIDAAVAREARRPFDMVAGPLVRGELFRRSASKNVFIFTAHHIICDGWSMNVILSEVAQFYSAFAGGNTPDLPQPLAFRSYALLQAHRDAGGRARTEEFWLRRFSDPASPLDLPIDRPRPARKSFNGATRSVQIDGAAYRQVKKAGARAGCTLFATLLAAYATLVGRLADRGDVVVGVPAAGQSLLDDEILVGHCVDFLPIRLSWSPDAALSDVLATAKQNVLDAFEHQSYTLGTLVQKLGIVREQNRLPLTEIQFNLERLSGDLEAAGLGITVAPNPKAFVNYDLFLNVIESDAGLRLDCDYNTDLFDATTIDRWLESYQLILAAMADDLSTPVARVSLLSGDERRTVLIDINATTATTLETTVHALFERNAIRRPHAPAVTAGSTRLTYADLDRRANELARYLGSLIPGTDRRIGVCVDRSADALIAMLAVLKAGHAFVPLDPDHPAARRSHIIDDSAIAALIVDRSLDEGVGTYDGPVIDLLLDAAAISDAPASVPNGPRYADDAAYVLYTSGSTGLPKGVEVTHRSVVNVLAAMSGELGATSDDILLAVATFSFDMGIFELFLPLSLGGHVVIASAATIRAGTALVELVASSRATVMQATPTAWSMLAEAGFASSPGFKMVSAGELLSRPLADKLLAGGGILWNAYGPTETTMLSACGQVHDDGAPITVGRPLLNTQLYVLDANDQPVPVGGTGQLHIGGTGVARGYVHRPELTAEKFVANPFAPGRMYRTGDAARLLATGDFQILGRLDDQVKLRGYRIELGEIEAVLARSANLAAAAAALREDDMGDVRLVAYFVERPEWPRTPAELREILTECLPEYMIPSAWVRLAALPLSPNGKLDRNALPAPDRQSAAQENSFVSPQTDTEKALAGIWAEVLGLDRVSTRDDIFALGADSIHFFRITARANKQGLALAAKQLMRHRTVAEVALQIDRANPTYSESSFSRPPNSVSRLTFDDSADVTQRRA